MKIAKSHEDKVNQMIKKFQQGGEMQAAQAETQEQAGGGDPMEQILQAAAQAYQAQDGNMALQVCGALVQMVQGAASGGGEAPVSAKKGNMKLKVKKKSGCKK